jgi:hypothetical protein
MLLVFLDLDHRLRFSPFLFFRHLLFSTFPSYIHSSFLGPFHCAARRTDLGRAALLWAGACRPLDDAVANLSSVQRRAAGRLHAGRALPRRGGRVCHLRARGSDLARVAALCRRRAVCVAGLGWLVGKKAGFWLKFERE